MASQGRGSGNDDVAATQRAYRSAAQGQRPPRPRPEPLNSRPGQAHPVRPTGPDRSEANGAANLARPICYRYGWRAYAIPSCSSRWSRYSAATQPFASRTTPRYLGAAGATTGSGPGKRAAEVGRPSLAR